MASLARRGVSHSLTCQLLTCKTRYTRHAARLVSDAAVTEGLAELGHTHKANRREDGRIGKDKQWHTATCTFRRKTHANRPCLHMLQHRNETQALGINYESGRPIAGGLAG